MQSNKWMTLLWKRKADEVDRLEKNLNEVFEMHWKHLLKRNQKFHLSGGCRGDKIYVIFCHLNIIKLVFLSQSKRDSQWTREKMQVEMWMKKNVICQVNNCCYCVK